MSSRPTVRSASTRLLLRASSVAALYLVTACGNASFGGGGASVAPAPETERPCVGAGCAQAVSVGSSTSVGTGTGSGTGMDAAAASGPNEIQGTEHGPLSMGTGSGQGETPDVFVIDQADGRPVVLQELDNTLNIFWLISEIESGTPEQTCAKHDMTVATQSQALAGYKSELFTLAGYFYDHNPKVLTDARVADGSVPFPVAPGDTGAGRTATAVICTRPGI